MGGRVAIAIAIAIAFYLSSSSNFIVTLQKQWIGAK
jgi:hypothetical protein